MLAHFKPQYATPIAVVLGSLLIAGVVYYRLPGHDATLAPEGGTTSVADAGPSGVQPQMLYGIPVPPPPPFLVPSMIMPLNMPVTGEIAGVPVMAFTPVGAASINRAATTTSFPDVSTDESLDPATMRLVSVEPFVLVQKSDGVHVEYVNASGIVAQSASEEVRRAATPFLLAAGGVVFTDQYGNRRVYGLGDGGRIDGLPATGSLAFVASSTRYLASEHDVYFITYHQSLQQKGSDFSVVRVQDADPATFAMLNTGANFARDAKHYFINGKLITDITPEGAPPLDYFTAAEGVRALADADSVYKIETQSDSGAHYLDSGLITKLARASISYRTIAAADPQAYASSGYTLKQGAVWYGTMKVAGADQATFEIITGLDGLFSGAYEYYPYGRDAHAVYYQGVAVPGADQATFLPVAKNAAYGADHARVFLYGTEVAGADPATFVPLWYPLYKGGCPLGEYAKDAAHVFYKDKQVTGADPATFEALLSGYGRDEHGIYYQGVLHPEIDPASFAEPECNYG